MIYIYCCKNRSELSQWDILRILFAAGGGSFFAFACLYHSSWVLFVKTQETFCMCALQAACTYFVMWPHTVNFRSLSVGEKHRETIPFSLSIKAVFFSRHNKNADAVYRSTRLLFVCGYERRSCHGKGKSVFSRCYDALMNVIMFGCSWFSGRNKNSIKVFSVVKAAKQLFAGKYGAAK